MTIDHRARAIELDERAGGSNDAAKSQALATRALVHAHLAALPAPEEQDAPLALVDVDQSCSGYIELRVLIADILGVAQEVADMLALALWRRGYRATWVDAAPQAVGA